MRFHLPALNHGVMDSAPGLYVIRINGHLGATVLSAFPAMASRQQGAETVLTGLLDRSALSVSPSTVSTHVRNIYAKLQVRDRSSAVQRARELRLLAAGRAR